MNNLILILIVILILNSLLQTAIGLLLAFRMLFPLRSRRKQRGVMSGEAGDAGENDKREEQRNNERDKVGKIKL